MWLGLPSVTWEITRAFSKSAPPWSLRPQGLGWLRCRVSLTMLGILHCTEERGVQHKYDDDVVTAQYSLESSPPPSGVQANTLAG